MRRQRTIPLRFCSMSEYLTTIHFVIKFIHVSWHTVGCCGYQKNSNFIQGTKVISEDRILLDHYKKKEKLSFGYSLVAFQISTQAATGSSSSSESRSVNLGQS